MDKKFYKNEKFQAVFFPVLYFGLSVALVITGCYIFKKKYYQPVIVDGKSMLPTLAGGTAADQPIVINGVSYPARYRYHYGIADLHEHSVNNIKRFDVIDNSDDILMKQIDKEDDNKRLKSVFYNTDTSDSFD